jgi:hypothetical protein
MKVNITDNKTGEQYGVYPIAVDVEDVLPFTNGGLFEKVWRLVLDAEIVDPEKEDDYCFTLLDDSFDGFEMQYQVKRKVREEIFEAHKHCIRNKQEILSSETSGCFRCLAIMKPSEITWFAEESEKDGEKLSTAFCPHCNIDTIIGSNSGYPITIEFLREMNDYWCNGFVSGEED